MKYRRVVTESVGGSGIHRPGTALFLRAMIQRKSRITPYHCKPPNIRFTTPGRITIDSTDAVRELKTCNSAGPASSPHHTPTNQTAGPLTKKYPK